MEREEGRGEEGGNVKGQGWGGTLIRNPFVCYRRVDEREHTRGTRRIVAPGSRLVSLQLPADPERMIESPAALLLWRCDWLSFPLLSGIQRLEDVRRERLVL
jgi:hypothetical protein